MVSIEIDDVTVQCICEDDVAYLGRKAKEWRLDAVAHGTI
jgi:hypothetical protein